MRLIPYATQSIAWCTVPYTDHCSHTTVKKTCQPPPTLLGRKEDLDKRAHSLGENIMAQPQDNLKKGSKMPFVVCTIIAVVAAIAVAALALASQSTPVDPGFYPHRRGYRPRRRRPEASTGDRHQIHRADGRRCMAGRYWVAIGYFMPMRTKFDNNTIDKVTIPRDTAYT